MGLDDEYKNTDLIKKVGSFQEIDLFKKLRLIP